MKSTNHGARRFAIGLGLLWTVLGTDVRPTAAATCQRCGWKPPASSRTQTAGPKSDLVNLIGRVRPGTTILLEDGVYQLRGTLNVTAPEVTLRGKSGDRSRVVLRGAGMDEKQVRVAVAVGAPRFTLADLTIYQVGWHGVQVRGEAGASDVVLHNIRVVDTGQQLVKGSISDNGKRADRGLVACSRFEYTEHAPSDYTNGVDVLGSRGWVVRDNDFFRIRGPRAGAWKCGPSILFWRDARDTVVERNAIIECHRGIALGLTGGDATQFDHRGGIVRNNVVFNLQDWADESIELNSCDDVRVDHNTVLVEGRTPWSISFRFPATTGLARNNLCNRPIVLRDGAKAELKANIVNARRDWFVDPARGDFRLAAGNLPAVDAGVSIPEVRDDFHRQTRASGKAPDAGALEWQPGKSSSGR